MENITTGATIQIKGTAYVVVAVEDGAQYPALRNYWNEQGLVQQLTVRRQTGRALYLVNQFRSGQWSKLLTVPGSAGRGRCTSTG